MKKSLITTLLLTSFLLACAIVAVSGRTVEGDVPAPPAIGATIADFTLPDADGKEHTLASLAGKNGAVLIFVATQCPVSNAYNERMEKLAQEYKAKGINVIGINSNVAETADAVKAHAAEQEIDVPDLERRRKQGRRSPGRHCHSPSLLYRCQQ